MFRTLVSQILDRPEPLLPSSLSSEVVTVFQYHSYFTSHGVSDLQGYLHQLAEQGGRAPRARAGGWAAVASGLCPLSVALVQSVQLCGCSRSSAPVLSARSSPP